MFLCLSFVRVAHGWHGNLLRTCVGPPCDDPRSVRYLHHQDALAPEVDRFLRG